VLKSLGNKIPLIVDGGQSQVGIESTVLDLSVSPPRLLRPGMIHEQALVAVTGELALGVGHGKEVLKSPGQLRTHYAPKAKLIVLFWKNDDDLRNQIRAEPPETAALSNCHVIAHTKIPAGRDFGGISVIPHDPEAFARAIYAELHECDEAGAELIVIEALPETIEWRAIADRLNRAAAN
jgi:L-threonylcarbamoyladenylate synthase